MSRYYVYILISEQFSRKYYIGITCDLEQRLTEHNRLKCAYSKRYAPWRLETYIAFNNETLANKFEKYLKQGSGHAFLKKHFI